VVHRPAFFLLALAVLTLIVALPVVAADPSTGPGRSGTVTVSGEKTPGATEIVDANANGKEIRARGKPAWAGGWKRLGKDHPGWSQEKADRFKAKFGDCFPPGQCKAKAKGDR
jgi:hypothetical protein